MVSIESCGNFPQIKSLAAERNLAIFDKRVSKTAKCRNYKFTAKSIRNDMQLYKGIQNKVEKITKQISALLLEMEKSGMSSKNKNWKKE